MMVNLTFNSEFNFQQGETKLLPSFRSNERVTDHNEANLIQTFVSHAKKVTQR